MEGTKYTTKESILARAQEIIGKPLKEVDATGRLSTGKGAIGTVIEESWYGYSPNSESEPDFPEAGVELKVTPYVRTKDGIRAKERLVCNIINYMDEYKKTFYSSAFWHKCETMLLMSYEHLFDKPKGEFTIDAAILFSFPEEDLLIIEHDWEIIMAKVRAGKAHEISEGDTMYLAACTKGANAQSVRSQPFSAEPAKQRAYSLKSSYMTHVLNNYIFGTKTSPKIIKSVRRPFVAPYGAAPTPERVIKCVSDLRTASFEEILISRLMPYYGKTQSELKSMFGIDSNAKNLNELLIAKMLGVEGKIAYTDEFLKAGIVPKTIRVEMNGTIRENMSFPTFDFIELSKETWEESTLYNYLAPTKFLFVVFQEVRTGVYALSRAMFWNIPNNDLEEVHRVWERTVSTIRKGVILINTPRGVSNNLPKQSESPVAHVRPHGRDGNDRLPLPDGRMMTKQCFWLNNSYIANQIKTNRRI